MKFIHTADWHLGLSFHNFSLIEDQTYALNQLIDLARETKPDVLIVAGDIYDRAMPPTDAVKLLDDVLCRLILDLKLIVILIAGNHDNPLRLEFASRLFETHRLYVFGSLSERIRAIDIPDQWGIVSFYPLPYHEPSQMSTFLGVEHIKNHEDALRQWIAVVQSNRIPESRTVLINHAFVVGGEESESERSYDVGGSGAISARCFEYFDYSVLGHLHQPQSLGNNNQISYSGSLLKYSFSEADHTKCIKLVEMDSKGVAKVEAIPLVPKHDVRIVKGTMEDLLQEKIALGKKDDYVQVQLLDKGAVFDPIGRLREILPNVVNVDHEGLMNRETESVRVDHRKREMLSLFGDFYQFVTGEPLTQEQSAAFTAVANRLRESERAE